MKKGDRVRIKFEYCYNSCNWGYIGDFDVEEVRGELFLYCLLDKNLRFFAKHKPFDFNPLEWKTIDKTAKPIFINCTGNEEWMNQESTIESIVKEQEILK